jgi:bacterioferritin-associated ferredoxin
VEAVWICFCKSVGSMELQRLIDGGARNLRQVGAACGAGTDCGHCKRTVKQMLDAATRGPTRERSTREQERA